MTTRSKDINEIRREAQEVALSSFENFVRKVVPDQIISPYHTELCEFLDPKSNPSKRKLIQVPRDHNKSRMAAFFAVYLLTLDPSRTILYVSVSLRLAQQQLELMQRIMVSDNYRKLWPDMVHPNKYKRRKWTSTQVIVDSPDRPASLRDYSIFAASMDTEFTGQHFDTIIYDDIVVYDNAKTEETRHKVATFDSLVSSIETADAERYIFGTPYHPLDLYSHFKDERTEYFDEDGNVTGFDLVYDVYERPIENNPDKDGRGEYLWPRKAHSDGKYYGFDYAVRQQKYRQYRARPELFWSQYYMDPTKGGGQGSINREDFRYFDPKQMHYNGQWYEYRGKQLWHLAAFDPAFSKDKKADWSAITVLATDWENFHYVLGTYRFRTDDPNVMYKKLEEARMKWNFRRVIIECIAAQVIIAQNIKSFANRDGSPIKVEHYTPTREGTKLERMQQTLNPLYEEGFIYHNPQCENLSVLEDELVTFNPPHDDCKDSLTIALRHAKKPYIRPSDMGREQKVNRTRRSKFGGM